MSSDCIEYTESSTKVNDEIVVEMHKIRQTLAETQKKFTALEEKLAAKDSERVAEALSHNVSTTPMPIIVMPEWARHDRREITPPIKHLSGQHVKQ